MTVNDSPMDIYKRYFPKHELSCYQQDLIEGTVKDLGAWERTLEFWAVCPSWKGHVGSRNLRVQRLLRHRNRPGSRPRFTIFMGRKRCPMPEMLGGKL